MAHQVVFNATTPDPETFLYPRLKTIEVASLEEALSLATARIRETGILVAADIEPDPDLLDLDDFLRWESALAEWLEENPIPGAFIPKSQESAAAWRARGVTTPRELLAFRDVHLS